MREKTIPPTWLIAVLMLFAVLSAYPTSAASATWNPAGSTVNFSQPDSWTSNGGTTPPSSGDALVFDADSPVGAASGHRLNNDLTNASFVVGDITFNATAPAYVIGDGTLTVNAGNPFILS